MRATKKYIKIMIMSLLTLTLSAMTCGVAAMVIVAIVSLIVKDPISFGRAVALAIVFGLVVAILIDLCEWLDKKFRPY